MLERTLRLLAVALSLFVTAGFVLFALDDIDRASTSSRERILGVTATDPTPAEERARERLHGSGREAIDDVNDVLLRPFAPLTDGADSRWVRRGVPALLGLLTYGFLLGFVARFSRGRGGTTDRRRPGSRALSS